MSAISETGALRPIEPIDIKGLAPRAPSTGVPIFETVDPRTLFVDPAYQRGLGERSIRQIRRIVEAFDWTRFKPPVCAFSEAEDGTSILKVIDGQHTAISAASNPHIGMIPVMIVEAPDVQSQASAFIGQNTDRLGMTATQLHIAALAARDGKAMAVAAVCDKVGIRIRKAAPGSGSKWEPGDTISVSAIAALLRSEGNERAEDILQVVAAAKFAPVKADHIKAIHHLFDDPQYGALDYDALPAHIEALGDAVMKEAKVFSSTHGVALWKALASVWFQKAKKLRSGSVSPAAGMAKLTSPLPEDLTRDTREAIRGWVPGNHVCRCRICDTRFRGDRRAIECAACAYHGGPGL